MISDEKQHNSLRSCNILPFYLFLFLTSSPLNSVDLALSIIAFSKENAIINLDFLDWWTNRMCVIAFLTRETWAQEQTISPRAFEATNPRQRSRQRFLGKFNPFFEVNVMFLKCSEMCYIKA